MIQFQLQQLDHRVAQETNSAPPNGEFHPFGEDGLTFRDVLDVVNPLQHIPLIGTLYRKLTGDTIDPAMRIAGGALFGGPIGAIASTVAVAFNASLQTSPGVVEEPGTRLAGETPEPSETPLVADPPVNRGLSVHVQFRPGVVGSETAEQPVATVQPRRGGWMVAQAYGDIIDRAAEVTRERTLGAIDLTV